MMIRVEYTEQEAQALKVLMHFAVQHKGLEAAEAASILARKLDTAAQMAAMEARAASLPVAAAEGSAVDDGAPSIENPVEPEKKYVSRKAKAA